MRKLCFLVALICAMVFSLTAWGGEMKTDDSAAPVSDTAAEDASKAHRVFYAR